MENLQYNYNEEDGIFYFSWEGATKVEDVANMWKEVMENNAIPSGCKMFLSDHRKMFLVDNIEDYFVIENIYIENPHIFKDAKLAIIVEAPKVTASFIVFHSRIKGITIKPFSTEKAAKKWLNEKS